MAALTHAGGRVLNLLWRTTKSSSRSRQMGQELSVQEGVCTQRKDGSGVSSGDEIAKGVATSTILSTKNLRSELFIGRL